MVHESSPVPAERRTSDCIEPEVADFVRTLELLQKRIRQALDKYRRLARVEAETDPFHLKAWLGEIEQMPLDHGLTERARRLAEKLDACASDAVLRLDADLRDACARHNWSIDGQWPQYYVQRVVRVEICDKEATARVGERIVPTLHVPALVKALETELKALLPRGFDPSRFLAALAAAFDRIPSAQQHGAPIWVVYREMLLSQQSRAFWRDGRSALFRPLGEQRFRAMLTALLEKGGTETHDGRQLRLLPPLKAEEAMYVYLPAEQRFAFVGRIDLISRDSELPI